MKGERGSSARRGRWSAGERGRAGAVLAREMLEDVADELGLFDAGDDLECAATALTDLDVDAEAAFQALHPAHGVVFGQVRLRRTPAACRDDRGAQAAVGSEEAMEA